MSSLLVAEPSVPIAAALRKFLEGDGRGVVVVSTREEALRELRSSPPDVLVTSLSATLDGEQLCRQAKQERPALPVLLLYQPEEEHPEARSAMAGADACLVGPLKRTMVLTCVQLLLKLAAAWRAAGSAGSGGNLPVLEASPEELEEKDDLVFFDESQPEAPAPPPVVEPAAPELPVAPLEESIAPLEASAAPEPAAPPARVEPVALPRPESATSSPDFEFFKRLLLMEVKRSRRYRYPIALLLVDLDRLAERTASLTPAQHTGALAETLMLLTSGVRDIDVAVPVADGRFVVFLPHTGYDGAMVVAERLREKVKAQHPVHDMTISVGMAVFEPGGVGRPKDQTQVSFGNLMKEAAQALRKAQSAGGDKVETHPPREPEPRDHVSTG